MPDVPMNDLQELVKRVVSKYYPNFAYNTGLGPNPDPYAKFKPARSREELENRVSDIEVQSGDPGSGPSNTVIPLVQRSPTLINKLVAKFGDISKIPVSRWQNELSVALSNPARGGKFWSSTLKGIDSVAYGGKTTSSGEGGKIMFNELLKPKNPLILKNFSPESSGLERALMALNPDKYKQIAKFYQSASTEAISSIPTLSKLTGLNNNQIKQVLGHIAKGTKAQILKERVGAELAKKAGYDSVVGLERQTNLPYEVVQLLK